MKFLTFVDLHEDMKILQQLVARAAKKDIDFVLCAGDFSTFGRGMRKVLAAFSALGKPFYAVPGNHEEGPQFDAIVQEVPQCVSLHRKAVRIQGYLFFGYGGNGFAQEDAEFRKMARTWYSEYQDEKIVFVSHAPPVNTTLDLLGEHHVGHIDYRKFIERIEPKLVIAGHLHETAGVVDKIGKTRVVNPGKEGMVIELK